MIKVLKTWWLGIVRDVRDPAFRRGLRMLGPALVRCWPGVFVITLLWLLLTQNEQARDLMVSQADANSLAFLLLAPLCGYFAILMNVRQIGRIARWRPLSRRRDRAFARACAPALVALAAALVLPLALIEVVADGDVFLRIIAASCLALAVFALWYEDSTARTLNPTPKDGSDIVQLVASLALGALWAFAPICTSVLLFAIVLLVQWRRTGGPVEPAAGASLSGGARRSPMGDFISLIFLATAAWLIARADGPPRAFGAVAVVMIAAGAWISAWHLLALARERFNWLRWPVLLAVCGATALVVTGAYNESEVRRTTANPNAAAVPLSQHLDRWLQARQQELDRAGAAYPVVIVAAEGGGIRAGYWTASVLAALADAIPGFNRHLLGLSGVSGGSVGAGVYTALVAAQADTARDTKGTCLEAGTLLPCARRILGADLLTAPLSATLLDDVLRSMRTSPVLPKDMRAPDGHDRTVRLERALENAFTEATGAPTLSGSFAGPWQSEAAGTRIPMMIANATLAEAGSRAVLAPLPGGQHWRGAADLAEKLDPATVPYSTALLLSARFPGISTTGRVDAGQEPLRLVDGGYADNSGIASAINLLDALMKAADRREPKARIEPIMLLIRNGRARDDKPSASAAHWWTPIVARLGDPATLSGVFNDPIRTIGGAWGSAPARHLEDLQNHPALKTGAANRPDAILTIDLRYGDDLLPLGWMLSDQARKALDGRVEVLIPKGDMAERLRTLLSMR